VLALLLFAGSLHVDIKELNRRRWLILLLATASVILSTVIFGAGMWATFAAIGAAVPLAWCFVLGAILAPTDAVVVEHLLQSVPLPPGLRAAIVGESLFNDGAGVVLFLLALGATQGEAVRLGHGVVFMALLREIVGGAALGLVTGGIAALLMRRVRDQGLQLLISLALVLGTYRFATVLDLSGPIAVVIAGLRLGSRPSYVAMEPALRAALVSFWRLLDQLLNVMLFLLIGLQLLALIIDPRALLPVVVAVPLAVAARGQRRLAASVHARKPRRQGTRYGDLDLGRIARRHLDCARFDASRYAMAGESPGSDLRGGDLHRCRAGIDDLALPADGVCGEKARLTHQERNSRVYCVS
jgi:monovalent cation:H+ antiporter, CPA1 family